MSNETFQKRRQHDAYPTSVLPTSQNFVKLKFGESHHGQKRIQYAGKSDLPLEAL